jgi:hypothetical protein
VIVLVPTGTPFSAYRQLEAERHHLVKEQQRRGATESLPNLLRAHLATNGTAGAFATSCKYLRPTNAAARHPAERRVGRPGDATVIFY